MADLIKPSTLKGFRDYLPELMIPRERLLEQARAVYRSYGFAPIDTPALEYAEILLGKGGEESDKITYRFKDHGDRDVALRFDLTVPLARFVAKHIDELGTPFKRYAIGSVFRGERPARATHRAIDVVRRSAIALPHHRARGQALILPAASLCRFPWSADPVRQRTQPRLARTRITDAQVIPTRVSRGIASPCSG